MRFLISGLASSCAQRSGSFKRGAGVLLLACAGTTVLVELTAIAAPNQLYSQGDPFPEEQYMLQLVNRARANPTDEAALYGISLNEGLAAGTISPDPKQPLCFNPLLLQAARDHSEWMLANSYLTHVETNGVHNGMSPGDRMQAAGYVFSGTWTWGENVAWRGQTGSPPPVGPAVGLLHRDLFVDVNVAGRGHRLNILNGQFREIGVGVKTGLFTLSGTQYSSVMSTEEFAASGASPGPFLVGVVYRDNDGDGFYTVGEGVSGVAVQPQSGTYYAVSSMSGGYAIPVTGLSGTLQVTFSGGPLTAPVTKSVALSGANIALDLELNKDAAAALAFVPGSVTVGSSGQFDVDVQGLPNALVTILFSTNLETWATAGQVTLTGGSGHFTDTPPAGSPRRFYRASSQ